ETARVGISDPRTDVYALGVMFYEMLTGTVPFTGDSPVDVMLKVVSMPVVPPRERAPGREITPEAERLIMKALAKDPRLRHQSMEEMFYELQQCYGSVRYRRSLETHEAADMYDVPHVQTSGPIPLQRVKPGMATPPGGPATTPPGTPQLRQDPNS